MGFFWPSRVWQKPLVAVTAGVFPRAKRHPGGPQTREEQLLLLYGTVAIERQKSVMYIVDVASCHADAASADTPHSEHRAMSGKSCPVSGMTPACCPRWSREKAGLRPAQSLGSHSH